MSSCYNYKLQIESYESEIKNVVENNRVTIIKGPTGCGKSTYVPIIFKDKKIAIIEPRRIAVTSLFNTLKTKIDDIGYKMRFSKFCDENTKSFVFTDGYFLTQHFDDFDIIIVDEVHERSIRSDLIVTLLRTFKKKLILMSATINTDHLKKYFDAAVIDIPGKNYSLDIKYLDEPTSDYIYESYVTIKNIIKNDQSLFNDERRDILVFLSGEEDINDLFKLVKKLPGLTILRIHSTMSDADQQIIFEKSQSRRIILSTNICETSLTIPNIKYVVDTGLYKSKIYNGISYLGLSPITNESADQRAGRCNRQGPGMCYRLYTENFQLPEPIPEILRSDLSDTVLILLSMNRNIFTLNWLDTPSLNNITSALEFLLRKGCVDFLYNKRKIEKLDDLENSLKEGGSESENIVIVPKYIHFKISKYGKRIIGHPFGTSLSIFYENCINAGVEYYGSLAVSLISLENYNFMFNSPKDKSDDVLFLCELMESYIETSDKQKFCIQNGLPVKGLKMAHKIFKTLKKQNKGNKEMLVKVFSESFRHNLCVRNHDGSYSMIRNDQKIFLHPSSGLYKKKYSKIVIVDLFSTSRVYGRVAGRFIE